MKRSPLLPFFALAFLLSWTLWAPLLGAHYGLTAGATPYLHLLGSLGPALAALVVSARLGRLELRALLRNVVRWRVGWRPWLFAVLGPALLLVAGLGVAALFGRPWPPLGSLVRVAEYPELGALGIIAAEILFYGFGEEVGWRGFALPRLEVRFGTLRAALVLSVPWALWHLPLLLRNETYAGLGPAGLAGWFFSLVTGSVLLAWLARFADGGLPVLAVFHGLLDVAMVGEGVSPLALSVMGALVTVAGVFAVGALRRGAGRGALKAT